jgi:hypothetical protein
MRAAVFATKADPAGSAEVCELLKAGAASLRLHGAGPIPQDHAEIEILRMNSDLLSVANFQQTKVFVLFDLVALQD